VVRRVRTDKTRASRIESSQAERKIIRFATRTGQHQAVQRRIKFAQQSLRVVENVFVQITRVCIQLPGLPADRLDNVRMAVANAGDVVVTVQVAPAIGVI